MNNFGVLYCYELKKYGNGKLFMLLWRFALSPKPFCFLVNSLALILLTMKNLIRNIICF